MDTQAARPVRLTDQALVAVTVARQAATGRGAPATVADLLVGLAAEPDGRAGELLRTRSNAAASLASRAGNVARGLASVDDAVRVAALACAPRPPGTLDLLRAALERGGDDLAELLSAAGYSSADLHAVALDPLRPRGQPAPAHQPGDYHETLGWDPRRPPAGLTPVAGRVVAQVRAVAGGATDVLLAVSAAPDARAGTLLGDADELIAAAWRLRKRGQDVTTPGWDRGLDAVVRAALADAELAAATGPVGTLELVRAAVEHGGAGPKLLVLEAQRHS